MDRFNTAFLYFLGEKVRGLVLGLSSPEKKKNIDLVVEFWEALNALESFQSLAGRDLKRSIEAAQPIRDLCEGFIENLRSERSFGEAEIRPDVRHTLAELTSRFTTILSADLAQLNLYRVSRKRIYDTDGLIENAEESLPAVAITILQEQPNGIGDIRDAGQCLAFSLSTAAAFHIFRVVESVVVAYFPFLPPKEWKDSERNLGAYTKFLEASLVDSKIIVMLNHLREEYRNPIVHPEVRLSMDEAIPLFGLAQSVIGLMALDISERKKAAAEKVLRPSTD